MPLASVGRRVKKPPLLAPRARHQGLDWEAIIAAMAVAVLFVGGLLAWAAKHSPGRTKEVAATRADVVAVANRAPLKPSIEPPAVVAVVERGPQLPIENFPIVEKPAPITPIPEPVPEKPAVFEGVAAVDLAADAAPTCDKLGTSVEFDPNPVRAAKQAAKMQKLLMVLHVSGNFEDAGFT